MGGSIYRRQDKQPCLDWLQYIWHASQYTSKATEMFVFYFPPPTSLTSLMCACRRERCTCSYTTTEFRTESVSLELHLGFELTFHGQAAVQACQPSRDVLLSFDHKLQRRSMRARAQHTSKARQLKRWAENIVDELVQRQEGLLGFSTSSLFRHVLPISSSSSSNLSSSSPSSSMSSSSSLSSMPPTLPQRRSCHKQQRFHGSTFLDGGGCDGACAGVQRCGCRARNAFIVAPSFSHGSCSVWTCALALV